MFGLTTIAAVAAVLALPASASALQSSPAGPAQRQAIKRSAAATQPCGYSGPAGQLSDFRTVAYHTAGLRVVFASVTWKPSPEADACVLIFVSRPGYTLKSVSTPRHPSVTWAPLTWGSSPFDSTASLSTTWHRWFSQSPPNWLALSRAL